MLQLLVFRGATKPTLTLMTRSWRSLRVDSWRKLKAVASPRISHQELGFGRIGFDFLAQAIDENAHIFEFITVIRAPNRLQEFAMRDRLIGTRKQVGEQVKFLCGQPSGASIHGSPP